MTVRAVPLGERIGSADCRFATDAAGFATDAADYAANEFVEYLERRA